MKFTEEHLWLRIEDGEDEITVGLTTYAVGLLGEPKFIELPEEGDVISLDETVVVIEGDDDAIDVLAPLDGEVVEINSPLIDDAGTLSEDPQGDGWLFKMSVDDTDVLDDFMSEAVYQKYIR